MTQELQEHFDDGDIIKLNMLPESGRWKEELDFLQKEVEFYRLLLKSDLIEKTSSNPEDADFLFHQLESIQQANARHLIAHMDYQNKLEGLQECDDVQCENFYIKDHLVQKEVLEKHFRGFRRVKGLLFEYLDKGLQAGD